MQIDTAVMSLAALAHPHRLAIFRLLARTAPGGLAAGEIAGQVGMTATNASFHLKELDNAGLIAGTREGRVIRYAIDAAHVRDLIGYLVEDCCQGRPEMCGAAIGAATQCCPKEE